MRVGDANFRTVWREANAPWINVIDQSLLPHRFEVVEIRSLDDGVRAIANMIVRGAPLIGVTAAYVLAIALNEDGSDAQLAASIARLRASRPTAVNLRWALERVRDRVVRLSPADRAAEAFCEADAIAEEDVTLSRGIARHGAALLADAAKGKARVNVLTHCNAGWLAAVDWGTALAPVYEAHRAGVSLHVWVDETRPRNQGASLTAWELMQERVPFTLIADNVGGHLMQHGEVDLCIVGSDRATRNGDVCNKIGTYLKALAAHDNGVPFYAALPFSTIDWHLGDGVKETPIEQRAGQEVTHITGMTSDGRLETVRLAPEGTPAANYAFDVTPARLVTAIITERGVCQASEAGLRSLYANERTA
ncbi:MAG: S-methyl-5-thioribose-1-phosphate isomerase [Hyphomonadaceae bacterium]